MLDQRVLYEMRSGLLVLDKIEAYLKLPEEIKNQMGGYSREYGDLQNQLHKTRIITDDEFITDFLRGEKRHSITPVFCHI